MGPYTLPMGRDTWAKFSGPGQAKKNSPKTCQDPKPYKNISAHMGPYTFPMGKVAQAFFFEPGQTKKFFTQNISGPKAL